MSFTSFPTVPGVARAARLVLVLAGLAAQAAAAQNFDAMIKQQMQAMNANIARGQQMVNQTVQQRMQDPQVHAGYRQYAARSGPAMDYLPFTYNWIYTNGFSAQGIAHARSVEAGNQARERAAWQGVQQAQAERSQAQRDGYSRNQQEAGRQLMGQSTYVAPYGALLVLPHTWQRNSVHEHQGQRYRVDAGGHTSCSAATAGGTRWRPGR